MKLFSHLKTITKHRNRVMILCFRCHLYKQGLIHDLSKYSFIELSTGAKYYQGYRSPLAAEKEEKGYSKAWLHHKGRNPHHWEYWIDFSKNGIFAAPMPYNYVVEMLCDRIAASETYLKEKYTDTSPLAYYNNEKHIILLHPKTREEIEFLLNYLATNGLDKTMQYCKTELKKRTK